jgi:hypothetical protein
MCRFVSRVGGQYQLQAVLNTFPQNPKIGINPVIFIVQYILLVKTCFYKIKRLWRITNFLNFFMTDKLYTTVLSFESHICYQAAKIRVNNAY